jgi:hypothetical protein
MSAAREIGHRPELSSNSIHTGFRTKIRGNTHFPMSDMNNLQIADQMSNQMSKFLLEKKLD